MSVQCCSCLWSLLLIDATGVLRGCSENGHKPQAIGVGTGIGIGFLIPFFDDSDSDSDPEIFYKYRHFHAHGCVQGVLESVTKAKCFVGMQRIS
jgi:hypothetical protein